MESYSAAEKLPKPTRGGVPWLLVTDGEEQTFYSMVGPDEEIVRLKIGALSHNRVIGQSPLGWLILWRPHWGDDHKLVSSSLSLWNPTTLETIQLPVLNFFMVDAATLTLPPHHPDSMVILNTKYKPQLAHCKLHCSSTMCWIVQDYCNELQVYYNGATPSYGFWHQAVCRGTLYAITLERSYSKLFEIKAPRDKSSDRLALNMLVDGGAERMPNLNGCARHLVDSDGELLQLLYCCGGTSYDEFRFVLVYKLDTSSMAWIQVRTLEGRSMFISRSGAFSCSNFGGGLKPNCVYYFQDDYQAFAFDIEKGQSSCSMLPLPPREFDPRRRKFIYVSFLNNRYNSAQQTTMRASSGVITKLDETYKEEEEKALILKLPADIHFNIAKQHLVNVSDYKNFHDSCKSFRSAAPIISPPSSTPLQSPQYPWFFFSEHYMNVNLKLHDLRCRNTFITHLPASLSDCFILHSKERWLLMVKSNDIDWQFNLYNPFTKVVRTIPDMAVPDRTLSIGISAAPTSPDCSIIGVSRKLEQEVVNIRFMRLSVDHQWHSFEYDVKGFIPIPKITPAFLANKFFFLDKYKQLGVFSYGQNGEGQLECKWDVYAWKCLGGNLGLTNASPVDYKVNYLVECGGSIVAVTMDYLGKSVRVHMLDLEKKGWLEVNNLGSHMLFLSNNSCFSTVAKVAGMENKIYFPRVSAKGGMVFYSLDTHKYHTFGHELVMDDFRPTSRVQLSGWFEPPNK